MAATDALRPHHVDRDPGHGAEILERLLLLLLPRCLGRRPLALATAAAAAGAAATGRNSRRLCPLMYQSAAITLVLSPPSSSDSSSTIDAIDQSSKNLTQQRDRSEGGREKKTKQARNCTQLLGDSAVATSDFGFGWIGNSSSSGGCYISHRDCSARGYGGRAAGGILVPP